MWGDQRYDDEVLDIRGNQESVVYNPREPSPQQKRGFTGSKNFDYKEDFGLRRALEGEKFLVDVPIAFPADKQ